MSIDAITDVEVAFKIAWHDGDLTPDAPARWQETRRLIKVFRGLNLQQRPFRHLPDLRFLNVHPARHRRMIPDMEEARAAMTPFFPSSFQIPKSKAEELQSSILDQGTRAQQLPPETRSHISNKFKPKSFWHELDTLRLPKEKAFTDSFDRLPKEWDLTTRPIIARLYKAGIIDNAVTNSPSGLAIAAKEPGRETPDLFIDFRERIPEIIMPPDYEPSPSREALLSDAKQFAAQHPHARFALLRLWSAPHFYPLMIGWDKRFMNSFFDCVGRAWEWKFIPKDMPHSEWSMHYASKLRLRPYLKQLGKNVVISRNLFMVMARDEAELLKLATATTFAIQTDPWRLEVDLWRSFVNVDLGFLVGMRGEWLD